MEKQAALASKEQALKDLAEQKSITSVNWKEDEANGYLTLEARNHKEAQAMLEKLPLAEFWDIGLTELISGG